MSVSPPLLRESEGEVDCSTIDADNSSLFNSSDHADTRMTSDTPVKSSG